MSGEPIIKHVEPHSLVMKFAICDYCGAPDKYTPSVLYLLGIKTCEAHHKWGIRDCEVYMHSRKMVRMIDAFKNPTLKGLFTYLEGTFPVRRSSGEIDMDWYMQCSIEDAFTVRDLCMNSIKGIDGIEEWCIPCKNGTYTKNIPIGEFLKEDIRSKMNFPLPLHLIQEVNDLLTKGIYYKSFEDVNEKQLTLEEAHGYTHPNVHMAFHGPSGKVIHCFIPDTSVPPLEPVERDKDPMQHS